MPKPLPKILSLRDAFAFREHVLSSAQEAGRDINPEYDKYPVFYYGNHLNIQVGDGDVLVQEEAKT